MTDRRPATDGQTMMTPTAKGHHANGDITAVTEHSFRKKSATCRKIDQIFNLASMQICCAMAKR